MPTNSRLSLAGLITLALAGLALPALAAQLTSTSSDPAVGGLINGGTINKVPTTVTTSITSSIPVAPSVSPDAIAIRIFDNADNLSPRAWYTKNIGARRSLQSLLVDGYDAVRDDRTVYVAAANIAPCQGRSAGPSCLKPIIVIVSFNQNISNETVDIFGQILANWRFNQNINGQPGVCSNGGGNLSCLSDQDCQSGQACDSLKARVVRDTRRLIDLSAMKTKLEQYRQSYQRYPSLESGTYLANKTLSVWPSWQKTLAVKMGAALPIDPINRLGASPSGYNQITGWNEQQRSFVTTWPTLPEGSRVYQYELVNNTRYTLCANFETNYQNISSYACANNHDNQGPVINCPVMRGLALKPFTRYASIYDNEGDTIDPAITLNQAGLTSWQPISIELVNDRRQIKLNSPRAGIIGRYTVTINAQDIQGATTSKQCTIVISNGLCGNDRLDSGEDCDTPDDIASSIEDSSPNRQYGCGESCQFIDGWCGDGQIKTQYGETCDCGNNSRSCAWAGVNSGIGNSSNNNQYFCQDCQQTGGWCGDGHQNASESCEAGLPYVRPDWSRSSATNQYACSTQTCQSNIGGWCGDGQINNEYGEQCESTGNHPAPTPANSSSTNRYQCSATTCQTTGGYCGDGQVDSAYGENCDPEETLAAFKLRINNNNIDQNYYNSFKSFCSQQKCQISCYDNDGDGYGLNPYKNCGTKTQADCQDQPNGADGLINTRDDGNKINPDQADDCTQYDGIDNNCDGLVDNKSIVSGNPLWSDSFIATQAVATNNLYANSVIDQTTGLNDSKSGKLSQSAVNLADRYIWPNICTNLNYNSSNCLSYANKTLTGLTWDISNLNLELNKNYIIKFNYQGSANLLHPTTTTLISGQTTTPANQVSWVLGYNNLNSASSFVTTTNNLVGTEPTGSFNNGLYIGSFNYNQALSQLYANGNRALYLSIMLGQNNLTANGSSLNIDNISITACQNLRPDGTWCGDGIIQTNHGEICEVGANYNSPQPYVSHINNQYGCSPDTCKPTVGGYCGDNILQSSYGETCDRQTICSTAESRPNNQYYCHWNNWQTDRCASSSGGWCGDGFIFQAAGERCDHNSTPGYSMTPNLSTQQWQYECPATSSCRTSNGWCGDGQIQAQHGETYDCGNNSKCCYYNNQRWRNCVIESSVCGDSQENNCILQGNEVFEQCDYRNYQQPSPLDSSNSNQYACSSLCRDIGGYCGDGNIQNGQFWTPGVTSPNPITGEGINYGEICDYNTGTPNWNTSTQFCAPNCTIKNRSNTSTEIIWANVPGNSTLGTSDFQVMAYPAYHLGRYNNTQINCNPAINNCVITTPSSTNSFYSVSRETAHNACAAINAHVITNDEWMTIVRNVENVTSNWTGGAIGSGSIVSSSPLTLSNGQKIYQLATSIEHVDTYLSANELPKVSSSTVNNNSSWYEYSDLFSYGLLGAERLAPGNLSWGSQQGYGGIYLPTGFNNYSPYYFVRGNGTMSGILNLQFSANNWSNGFRCVKN